MRGKRSIVGFSATISGLIPAHAGKTSRSISAWLNKWAHPRACGENYRAGRSVRRFRGSSPRMRGKPAAGSPCTSRKVAHPRACGENVGVSVISPVSGGSSPRMRGKPRTNSRGQGKFGLIPAHAGKTREPGKARSQVRAHPRACGENIEVSVIDPVKTGSSPRMRGKRRPNH